MFKHPRHLVLYAGLAAVTTAGLCYALGEPPRQRCRLPDGSTVTLEGVTYGSGEHRFASGNRLRRALALALPPEWASRFGCEPMRYPPPPPPMADAPRMVCWFNTSEPPTVWRSYFSLWTVASDGMETHVGLDASEIVLIRHGLAPYPVTRFPREGDRVTFHLYAARAQGAPQVRSGVFRVPNPTPGPFPIWTAEALPASRRAGDVQVTLTELFDHRMVDVVRGQPPRRATSLRLHFRDGKGKRSDWRPVEVVLSDASGNKLNVGWQRDCIYEDDNGDWSSNVSDALPTQNSCKVTVRLARRRDVPRPARVSVAPPPPGKTVTLNRRVPVYGGDVVLERIHAPGDIRTTNSYSLDARLEGFASANATVSCYEEGNPFNPGTLIYSAGPMTWSVGREGQAGPIDLTFERQYPRLPVSHFRTVEFFARPTPK